MAHAAKRNPARCPTHPGALLREDVIPATGRTKAEIAQLLGISRQHLYDILRERKPVSPAVAVRLGKLFGDGAGVWVRMQAAYDTWHAEPRNRATCARPRRNAVVCSAAYSASKVRPMTMMMIFAIVVALVVLYWLGSLAYHYVTNPAERARLNKQPGQLLIALLAVVLLAMLLIGILVPAFGNLSIFVGDYQFRIWTVGLAGCVVVTAAHFLFRGRA
jgi:antitoxin HigA-1